MQIWTTEEEIGELGGFGIVYKSRKQNGELIENKYYAKKILNKDDAESIRRFQKEVRLSEKLKHPRIIEIISKKLNNQPYFYIMPLYDCSMQNIMNELKEDYSKIKNIFNQIFEGVEYLHSEGIFHRDLKPANILMNSDGELVISDFGLGVQRDSSTRFTRTGMGMGTEFFASPEQMEEAKDCDERTDIYSLGCMIYLCFIKEPMDIRIELTKMPPLIENVVRKATAYKKEERFNNIDSLRKSFNAAIDILSGAETKDNFKIIMDRIKIGELTEEFINSIALIINKNINNPDQIHEIIMSLSEEQVKLLCIKHFLILKRSLITFKEHITTQSWSFNYTDNIGRQCHSLYYSIDNHELRAILIYIIVQVGSSHNRWYVMDLARKILKSIKNQSEAFEISSYIEKLEWELDYLKMEKEDLFGNLKRLVN